MDKFNIDLIAIALDRAKDWNNGLKWQNIDSKQHLLQIHNRGLRDKSGRKLFRPLMKWHLAVDNGPAKCITEIHNLH